MTFGGRLRDQVTPLSYCVTREEGSRVHPELAAAVDDLRLTAELPALAEAAELSQGLIDDSRAFLQTTLDIDLPVDLVVLGSVARGEVWRRTPTGTTHGASCS